MHSEQTSGSILASLPADFSTDQIFVKAVYRHAMLANTTFHARLATISAEVVSKYHAATDGRPALPSTATDGSVIDVEMPPSGYAPGPLKTIASMERKARKIMTEPQNSDPTAAANPFHRNHQFPWAGCLTDCNRATIAVQTSAEMLRTIELFEAVDGKEGFSLVRINNSFAQELKNRPFRN